MNARINRARWTFPKLRAALAEQPRREASRRPACPVCGGRLIEIRAKVCCSQCHAIVETCCD